MKEETLLTLEAAEETLLLVADQLNTAKKLEPWTPKAEQAVMDMLIQVIDLKVRVGNFRLLGAGLREAQRG